MWLLYLFFVLAALLVLVYCCYVTAYFLSTIYIMTHSLPNSLYSFHDNIILFTALQVYRGVQDVSCFINEMRVEQIIAQKEPQWSFKQLLTSVDLRMPLLLVLGLSVAQQLSGANVVRCTELRF